MDKPSLAVIGSGIAGLSAAWLLKDKYQVTLFERHQAPGMGAYAVDVGNQGNEVIIDIPLRIITAGYYQELFNLYKLLGVEIERTDHAGAFFTHTGGDVFHYKNYSLGKYSFSFLNSPKRLSKTNLIQGMAAIKFFYEIKKIDTQLMPAITFGEFLLEFPYAQQEFVDHVLMPMLATICTCDYDSVRQYPACIIIDYLACGVAKEGVWKAKHGVSDIISRITQGYQVRANCEIEKVECHNQGVRLKLTQGEEVEFDQLVVATLPHHAAPLVAEQNPQLAECLRQIDYETSEMVVHRDQTIYPRPWQDLSPVCYSIDKDQQRPMATVCLNKSMPTVRPCLPVFQTWHPTQAINAQEILASVQFERPVMNFHSLAQVEQIKLTMEEENNRIWFSGSYLGGGIPLLEAGVRSSLHIANKLGIASPW